MLVSLWLLPSVIEGGKKPSKPPKHQTHSPPMATHSPPVASHFSQDSEKWQDRRWHTILTKIFTDRLKNTGDFWDVGNFYRCRLQIPRNFGSVILSNLPTRVPLCLLNNAKAPVGMTDLNIERIFWGIGNFYRYRLDFKFLRICLVNISVGMVWFLARLLLPVDACFTSKIGTG